MTFRLGWSSNLSKVDKYLNDFIQNYYVYMSIFLNAKPKSLAYFVLESQNRITWHCSNGRIVPSLGLIFYWIWQLYSVNFCTLSYYILTIQSYIVITKPKVSKSLFWLFSLFVLINSYNFDHISFIWKLIRVWNFM